MCATVHGQLYRANHRKSTAESTKETFQNRVPNPFRHRFRYRNRTTNHQHPPSISVPKMIQKSVKIASFLVVLKVKTLPDRPLEAQGSPGGSPEGPRRVSGEPRGSPKAAQSRSLEPPRSAKGAPRVTQSHPRAPRSTPKSGKSRQKRTQDRFRSRCRSRTTFEADSRPISLRNCYQNLLANRWRTAKKSFVKVVIDQGSDVARIIVLP